MEKEDKKEKLKFRFKCMACGVFIGILNGLLGGGGGMLAVPILEKVYRIDNKSAHSTALVVMLPLCVVSGIVYLVSNNIDLFTLGFSGIGVVAGGVVGALLLKNINSRVLRFIFSLLILAAAISTFVRAL